MKKLVVTLLAISIAIGMASLTTASEDSDVEISVDEETIVDVQPANLDFGEVNPGSYTETASGIGDYEDVEFGGIEIENLGSTYVEQVWVESTTPDERPFGTDIGSGNPYDAGNFLQVSPSEPDANVVLEETTGLDYFVNRREYSEQAPPSYLNIGDPSEDWDEQTGTVGTELDDALVGRFRVGGEEYFWAIPQENDGSSDASGTCDGSQENILRVGNTEHTTSELGTVDFTDEDETTDYDIESTDSGDTGVATNVDIDDRSYDILTYCEDPDDESIDGYTERTRYNVNPDGNDDSETNLETSQTVRYIMDVDASSNPDDSLVPGQGFSLPVSMQVPLGVAADDITEGELRILSTATNPN